jgi:hypothetical protein
VPTPNSAFTSDCYVPILACRAAERDAIAVLDDRRVAPLLIVRDADVMAAAVARAWHSRPGVLFVQAATPRRSRQLDAACSLATLFDRLRGRGVPAVPVIAAAEDWSIDAVAGIARRDGRGVLIRLDVDGLAAATSGDLWHRLRTAQAVVGGGAQEIDVLLDIGLQRTVTASADVALQAVNAVSGWDAWRNVMVSFTGHPGALSGVSAADPSTRVVRDDFAAYGALLTLAPTRVPVFADVGVRLPMIGSSPSPVDAAKNGRAHMRVINAVMPGPTTRTPNRRAVRTVYLGTSWSPPVPCRQAVHSHLTNATVRHVGDVLERLSERNRAPVTRPARAP